MDIIDSFKGEYSFLSNFYQYPVTYGGLTYPTAEAAFQAQKCQKAEDKVKYTQVKNPVRAKQMGRKEPNLPAIWESASYHVMREVLRAKFSEPEMAEKLLATGNAMLVEGNTHHDNIWGNCTCPKCTDKVGQNRLGQLLMGLRYHLAQQR